MSQPGETDIDRQIEVDYVLERLQDIRNIVAELLEGVELDRWDHWPFRGTSAIESIASATYAAERLWTR